MQVNGFSETVVTVVASEKGGLDGVLENRLAETIKSEGVERIDIRPLEPGRAVDFILNVYSQKLNQKISLELNKINKLDCFFQLNNQNRKKRLLAADMDSTMIEGELLDELAQHFNVSDKVKAITEKAMRGELDFQEALRQRVGLFKGMPESMLHQVMGKLKFSKGAETVVRVMKRHGARCILVSGGFDLFTRHVAQGIGFDKDFGNRLVIQDGKLTGEVVPPILDGEAKKRIMLEEARALQIDPQQVMAVGDGANDIPMLKAAGTGVSYFGKPAVEAAASCRIRHTDLTSLLYMQGYGAQALR